MDFDVRSGGLPPNAIELSDDVFGRDASRDSVSVDSPSDVSPFQVVDPEYGIASVVLVEPFRRLEIGESVDEDRDETAGGLNHFGIAQRTAGEVPTTGSARIFTEVKPKEELVFFGVGEGVIVVHPEIDRANPHRLTDRAHEFSLF